MPVELLISPPATGKTETCIRRLRSTLHDQPLALSWVVLPDRLQSTSFRRRLAATGGLLGGKIGRFEDLYAYLLEQTGSDVPVASAPLLHRLVQETVDIAIQNGEISHYTALQNMPGFILALRDAFAELKRSLVYPDAFLQATRSAPPAQRELGILYARYQTRLRDLNWADPEGLSWLAVKALQNNPSAAARIRLLIVDGFDSFTGAQHAALQLLGAQVGELLISLPGEPETNRPAHHRFLNDIHDLSQELTPRLSRPPGLPRLSADLVFLEQNLFETAGQPAREAGSPFLLEARSPSEEAREALRWIKALVMREEIPLEQCAIFSPNPDQYHGWLRMAAAEFGIPLHFTRGEALLESAPIRSLLNLLALPAQNYRNLGLFACLRSPYFDFGFDQHAVDDLEDISRKACIVEGRAQWDETWERLTQAHRPDLANRDEETNPGDLPDGNQNTLLQEKLGAFFTRTCPAEETNPLTNWIAWLEDLLEDIHFYDNASSERDQLACDALRESLRALVLSETITGVRRMDYAGFLTALQATLDGAQQPEPPASGQPDLLVGRINEARGVRFTAVALLGLSEGIFPAVEREDPFLGEDLRRVLNLEPRLQREQAGLFYQAITRSDRHLLITRPYLSDDGETWEASPFWKNTASLFTKSALQTIRPDDPRPLADAASSQEVLFWAVRGNHLPQDYQSLRPRWDMLHLARQVLSARRARKAQGIYEGNLQSIAPLLSDQYPPNHQWSASRLESYSACPLNFLTGSLLKLEARALPGLGLDASQAGSMLHKILEQVYKQASDPADPAAVLAVLPTVAREVFANAPREYGFRPSPLWQVEQEQYLTALQDSIQALAEEGQDWTPFAYEQTFGIHGSPALQLDLESETLRMHGIIDRIDHNSQGQLRVIDYKTGSRHMGPDDLREGLRLQLPVYALAARDALHLGEPADGLYWQILNAKSGTLKLAKFKSEEGQGPAAAIQVARDHLQRIMLGIRAGDFSPAPPRGGCPAYCPAAQWCWRFSPGW